MRWRGAPSGDRPVTGLESARLRAPRRQIRHWKRWLHCNSKFSGKTVVAPTETPGEVAARNDSGESPVGLYRSHPGAWVLPAAVCAAANGWLLGRARLISEPRPFVRVPLDAVLEGRLAPPGHAPASIASSAHQRRSRPAPVRGPCNSSRHQVAFLPSAPLSHPIRIAPAAVAFSHQVLPLPAVAIHDLPLRPAAPHLQRLGRQATLPPPVHLALRGPGAVPPSPPGDSTPPTGSPLASPRGSWPCQFSPPGSPHSCRWAGRVVDRWTSSPGQSLPLPRF